MHYSASGQLQGKMFSTPTSSNSHRGAARRLLQTAVGRLNCSRDSSITEDTEQPIASEVESNTEVLTILRSLQQQVSTLQAQQQATQAQACPQGTQGTGSSTASTPNSAKRRLPKDLVVSC